MSLKIRLQRQGKKKQAFYHIVVADSRAARDGKYVERLGTYNPRFDREGVTLDNDKTLQWLEKGAVPTTSCRNLLSERGLMYKKHLNRGVRKGIFTQEQADAKFTQWVENDQKAHSERKEKHVSSSKEAYSKRMEAEKATKEAKAKAVAAKKAAAAEAAAAAAAPAAEAAPVEGAAEAPQA
jgi:small subunit ribosomal protein S16